jgi:hypothetical protein
MTMNVGRKRRAASYYTILAMAWSPESNMPPGLGVLNQLQFVSRERATTQ